MSSSLALALSSVIANVERKSDEELTAFLSTLAKSYVVPEARATLLPAKPSKLALVKAQRASAGEANETKPHPTLLVTMPLPDKGSLGAHGFVMAMRRAGLRRNDNGFPYTDQGKVRDDKIRAIAAYIGYDPMGNFGAQEWRAMTTARQEIQGTPQPSEYRRNVIMISVAGFVNGMPDDQQRQALDLIGRQRLSNDTAAEHRKLAEQEGISPEDKTAHLHYAKLEDERGAQIHADLMALLNSK